MYLIGARCILNCAVPCIFVERSIDMLKRIKELRATLKSPLYTGSIMTLVLSIIMMLAFYAFYNNSTAWFVFNPKVTAEGMSVTVNADAQLVISDSSGGMTDSAVYELTNDVSSSLMNATVGTDVTHPIVYIDPTTINPATSEPTSDSSYLPGVEGTHYYKRTIYIGSSFHSLTMDSIGVNFVSISGAVTGFQRALSCYVVYNGHGYNLNLNGSNHQSLDITSLDVGTTKEIEIYFYYDGALKDSSGNYILTSSTVDKTGISVSLSFTAVNAVSN